MKKRIRALVIDSDPIALKRVVNLIQDIDEITLIKQCDNGEDGIKSIIENRPDLIFIDVHINDMTGFDVLTRLPEHIRPFTIFITADEEFALKAFDSFAFDYLVKPYKDDRFLRSVNRIIEIFNLNQSSKTNKRINQLLNYIEKESLQSQVSLSKKIPFKYNGKILLLETDEINYVLASGSYVEVYVSHKKHLLRESLSLLEKRLPKTTFYRIHRSTIININQIEEIIISNYREIDVKMKNNKLLRVSIRYKNDLLKLVGMKDEVND